MANVNLLSALLVDKHGWDSVIYEIWFDNSFRITDYLKWVENVQSLPNAGDKDHPASVFFAHICEYYKNLYLASKESEGYEENGEEFLGSYFLAILTWNGLKVFERRTLRREKVLRNSYGVVICQKKRKTFLNL